MGHDGYGRITAVGSDVRDRQVGQSVVIEPNYACLKCADCLTGLTSACPHWAIVGLNVPGVLAERVALPAHFAHPVPDGLTGADLAATEPYTVARAAVRRSGVTAADRCLVVGAGAQGLLTCLILARLGIEPVVTEPHPQRLARAERLGATPDDGRTGFTYVFETSGHAPALRPAVDRADPGATFVLVGLNSHRLPLTTDDVVRRQLMLRGSMIYDHPGDFAAATAELPEARPGVVIEALPARPGPASVRRRRRTRWKDLDQHRERPGCVGPSPVSLSGSLTEKLTAAARAGFDGVEIFENDLLVSPLSPEETRARGADLGLTIELYQPMRDVEAMLEEAFAGNLRRAER